MSSGLRCSRSTKVATCVAIAVALCAVGAQGADKSGVSPDRLRLPTGPGSLEGTGENVEPNLSMGLMSYRVAVALPAGYPGLTPDVSLLYDSGAGNSLVGIGWSLHLPAIERMTARGLPRYTTSDTFAVDGSDELVAIPSTDGTYRARFEKGFVRYTWLERGEGGEGYFLAEYPDGRKGYFGARADGTLVPEARVAGSGGTFRFHLVEVVDTFDHQLLYDYEKDGGVARLAGVRYVFVGGEPRYTATLSYKGRPDELSDAKPGVELRASERLARIEVRARGAVIRRYDFRYEDELEDEQRAAAARGVSRLESVRWFGAEDGEHPIHFSFGYSAGLGQSAPTLVRMKRGVGVDFRSKTADLVDLDGDALPDVVDTADARHRIFLNQGGTTFADVATSGDGTLKLEGAGVNMLDLDGDGHSDMLDSEHKNVLWNLGTGDWKLEETPAGFNMPSLAQDENLRFFDYDDDKRMDLLHADRSGTWVAVNQGGGRFSVFEDDLDTLGASFQDDRLQLVDVNGDGLQDVVRMTDLLVEYRLNLGFARFAAWKELSGMPANLAANAQLVDLNGDGLADVVAVLGDAVIYALNRSGLELEPPVSLTSADIELPERIDEMSVRFADMNGSGSTDIVWIDASGNFTYLELFPERPNLLVRIDNGIGKVLELDYGSSVEHLERDRAENPWTRRLPHPMLTVDELIVRDELSGVEQRQLFHYRNGHYDGTEHQFRGFADVIVTTPGDESVEAGTTTYHFDVGAEQLYKKGLLLSQSRESAGELIDVVTNDYDDCKLSGDTSSAAHFACLTGTTRKVVERGPASESKTLRESYEYDGYGDRTFTAKLGVTDIAGRACEPCQRASDVFGAPCGESCLGDERYERTWYVTPSSKDAPWTLGKPWRHRVSGTEDGIFSEELTYYDGDDFVGAAQGTLTRGLVSRVRVKVSDEQSIDREAYRYDLGTGAVLETRNARGYRRVFGYDDAGLLVESETIHFDDAAREQPYALRMTASYDPRFDTVEEASSWRRVENDEVVSSKRPTRFTWDEFGRLSTVTRPGDDVGTPTEAYEYLLGPLENDSKKLSRIIHRTRSVSGGELDLEDVQCFDGLGRKLQARTRVDGNRFQVSGFTEFNVAGQPWKTYQPDVLSGSKCESAPPDRLFSETRYDATGRTLESFEPDADVTYPTGKGARSSTLAVYSPLATLSYDAEDNDPDSVHSQTPSLAVMDGLGRTVRQERRLRVASEGSEPLERSVPIELEYDSLGNLRGYLQPHGDKPITKVQEYDLIGRVISVTDPDSGLTTFDYDAAGNVVRETDARGKVTRSEYDEGNRLLRQWEDATDASTPMAYEYDVLADCEECTNLEGQLARVSFPTGPGAEDRGSDAMGYDARGQLVYSRRDHDGHVFELRTNLDNAGRTVRRSYPTGHELEFELDGAGRLTGIPGYVTDVSYEKRGLLQDVSYVNEVATAYTYDDVARLESLHSEGPAGVIQHYVYSLRDRVGNIIQIDDETDVGDAPSASAHHEYDDWYRLTESRLDEGRAAAETLTVAYDEIDNITSKTSSIVSSPDHVGPYTYDRNLAGPHAVTQAGDLTLRYDAAGNMTDHSDDRYDWDFMGRMTAAYRGDRAVGTFTYGPGRQRIKKDEDGHIAYYVAPDFEVRDGAAIIYASVGDRKVAKIEVPEYATTLLADLAPGNAVDDSASQAYASQPDGMITAADAWVAQALGDGTLTAQGEVPVDDALVSDLLAASARRLVGAQSEAVTWLHHNHLGSTVATTDAYGAVTQTTEYYPYGEVRARDETRADYSYTGQERDEGTGLSYHRARYLNLNVGRWVSVDPLFGTITASATYSHLSELSGYAYSRSSPIVFSDLTGNEAESEGSAHAMKNDWARLGWRHVEAARTQGVDPALNDMKVFHAGNNAEAVKTLASAWSGTREGVGHMLGRLFAAPAVFLVGSVGYETYTMVGYGDQPAFDGQPILDWAWDTVGDIHANLLGIHAGLMLEGSRLDSAVRAAQAIPGPDHQWQLMGEERSFFHVSSAGGTGLSYRSVTTKQYPSLGTAATPDASYAGHISTPTSSVSPDE